MHTERLRTVRPDDPAPAAAPEASPALRADALHNRTRIVEAARESFAARGLDVPMAAIARRAGVGVATLYRRFPTKETLIAEAFTEEVGVCVAGIQEALADPDPWRGFCTVIEQVCATHATDKGFTTAFLSAVPGTPAFDRERECAERGFALLTRRAKDAGRLRADFAHEDLALILMANSGITADSTEEALAASRRLVAYLLHSFRAGPATEDAPLPPPTPLRLTNILGPRHS
ncbi:TetR/AcrR family transcriptional regulator [Streptomyces corynorhini]|uniref:TetR/AcrR family transcriptional regulator n=1 Tax=Streptomyces corynorhini TaxID=2282652 RepID=A0A370BDV0_9ACTN|nr:TetR/AcrR family transcriptional regulator [Streptomyces corynorhini]RDG39947.1 TetR/AcrR family transcriptional regulator [Streptomyces corynorhini]